MNINDFFLLIDRKKQFQLFPILKKEIDEIVKIVLWSEFRKKDIQLIEECTSFILERLIEVHAQIQEGKERAFIYKMAKRYFQECFFDKNIKTVFIDDLLKHDVAEEKGTDDLEDLKLELIDKFKQLVNSINDKTSLSILSSLVYLIKTEQDYNSQFVSLYLFKKTGLGYDVIYRCFKRMNINISLSRQKYFHKIFAEYKKIKPFTNDDKIISNWERSAIFHFENKHERTRGENYEHRHFRTQSKNKLKSTPTERIEWLSNFRGDNNNMEKAYYEKFGMSYRTFKSDKKCALT